MVVAILFATDTNPHFPNIWDKWIDNGNEPNERCDIYIHPKFPDQVTWRRESILPKSHLSNSYWNDICGALLAYATSIKTYTKYVIVSESDIPVRPFDTFYRSMCRYPDMSLYTNNSNFALCHKHAVEFTGKCPDLTVDPSFKQYNVVDHWPNDLDDLTIPNPDNITDLTNVTAAVRRNNPPYFCGKFAQSSNVDDFWHRIVVAPLQRIHDGDTCCFPSMLMRECIKKQKEQFSQDIQPYI